MKNYNKQKGFTLVELLFVIAIIILLALISIDALNGQRAKARDAKRKSDVRQISTALEFYFLDEGEYPLFTNTYLGRAERVKLCPKKDGGFVGQQTECNAYMTNIPHDPSLNKNYIYNGSDKGYAIAFTMEKESDLGGPGTYYAHTETIDSSPDLR